MADQLKQIVSFLAVPPGGSVTMSHNINAGGVAYIPDEVEVDNGDFRVTACTSTSITVFNNGVGATNCDVLLQLWQSNTRALGASTQIGNFTGGLTPRPFIGASSGGGSLPVNVAYLDVFQTFTKAQNVAQATLVDAATIVTDANLANGFHVTIAGNRLLDDPTDLVAGGTYLWVITQGAGGSHLLTYGALFSWPGGTPPTLSTAAGAVDLLTGYYDGTKLRMVYNLNFS